MNLLSDTNGLGNGPLQANPSRVHDAMATFIVPETRISAFEFRQLSSEDADHMGASLDFRKAGSAGEKDVAHRSAILALGSAGSHGSRGAALNSEAREAAFRSAVDTARQDGLQQGERDGRTAAQAEMEAEMQEAIALERQRLVHAVSHFDAMRERYFADVEQEVVKLALAIAARVLHREAQIDPLLLAGVVRVALEKMADRSGVVLRVAGSEVEAWVQMFHATEESERPRVAEDARLARGECVLETKMGTVELGVSVQLEEIEKGFFDLLNHRPVD